MSAYIRLAFLSLIVCTYTGCVTIDEGVNYALFEPVANQVRYRVSVGDELDLVLSDGAHAQIKVHAIDESFIYREDGRAIAIEEIQELRNPYTINLAQGTAALLFYGVAGPLSVLALPIAVPMILLYDEEAVTNWRDDRLCRVSEHPDHYGYSISGSNNTDTPLSSFEEVSSEIGKRGLRCDAVVRAERHCAYISESGTSFMECTTRQIPREKNGIVDIPAWSDSAVCIELKRLNSEQELAGSIAIESTEFVAEVAAEKRRRELDCEA